jgi:copper chaperone NosL
VRSRVVVLLGILLLLASCGQESGQLEPPEIRYGRDTCAQCGMIISDPRFAAAAATGDGSVSIFDDIGDLLAYRKENRPDWIMIWVHDYNTQEWLRAEDAWYLLSPAIHSPMGWGIAAFASEEAARTRQAELGGELLRWEELLARELTLPAAH